MAANKIMIIDDETGAADLLKHRLEREGYEVLALPNAREVISKLYKFVPDIIILDLLMPDCGGLDVCEMLNKEPLGLRTPIIVVSGLNKDVDKKKAFTLGIEEYFVKPVDMDVLLAAIKKHIRNKNDASGN